MNPVGSASLQRMANAPELIELRPTTTAVIDAVIPMSELVAFFDRSFSTLPGAITGQGASIVGPAFARYHGPPTDTMDLEVGFPTDGPIDADGDVRPGTLPAGRAARLVHAGSYEQLGGSWERLQRWIAEQGLTPTGDLWEVYVTEPSPDMNPADLRTELCWLVA